MATNIKGEMRTLSSDDNDSILRDTVEAVKNFSWETIMLELKKHTPTLMSLLSLVINKPSDRIPQMCFIASLILKCQHQRLCLVQRAVSVMLYGNGCAKQVNFLKLMYMYTPMNNYHNRFVRLWRYSQIFNLWMFALLTKGLWTSSTKSLKTTILMFSTGVKSSSLGLRKQPQM